jgi:Polyketide cyclase / dehydrase and lipid transport
MKIFLLLLLGLGLIVIAILVIGALLPRAHLATRSAVFQRPPAEVYSAARDFGEQPSWNSGVKRVELLPAENGQARFRVTTRHGDITYRVLEERPNEKLVTEIADENLPFGGRWIFEFSPAPRGTSVRITEQGVVKNVLFRFLARFAFGYTATMERYLRDLGRKFDETVTPQP